MIASRGARKIKPPRKNIQGDDVDLEPTWVTLSDSFREIHTQNASQLSYEQLYRHAYVLVLKRKGDQLYKRVIDFEHDWLSEDIRPRLHTLASSALLSFEEYDTKTVNERRVSGELLLKGATKAWDNHQTCINMLADVLMYLDRVYCREQRRTPIFEACMELFRDTVLKWLVTKGEDGMDLLDVLSTIILDQVRMERDGDTINKHFIRSCVHMMESLNESNTDGQETRLYVTRFQPRFLKASTEFYREESERLIRENDAGTYCRWASRRIREEEDRCRSTLSESTTDKIRRVVEDELIRNKIAEVIAMPNGVKFMSDNNRIEELSLVYNLNARVDSKKTELITAIQKRVAQMGDEINRAALAASHTPPAPAPGYSDGSTKSGERVVNQHTAAAMKWVEDVLQLKDKFDTIWRLSFASDQALQAALSKVFSEFINAATFPRGTEYISLFIDDNMKKGIKGKTEHEVDLVLDKAITLLRYVQDKDMFEKYYKKHLSRRLLMNKSVSNDVEKQMISRMKIELGNNFTSKLESMFKDMTVSEELSNGYRAYVDKLGDYDPARVDLSMHVLTATVWPLDHMSGALDRDPNKQDKAQGPIFPPEIERVKKGFEKFYLNRHSGRVLSWLGGMGTADIRAVFPKVPTKDGLRERKHELNVSTYAMIILLLFNDLSENEALTYEEIEARTNIPPHELTRNLQSLSLATKTRILLKEPMTRDIKPTDRFKFNEGFSGKFIRIKVGVVSAGNRVENDKERQDTDDSVRQMRAHYIEATIVRIMKQRKTCAHLQLISETISQLASHFKPEVTMIKKRIESLLDKEYLARMPEDDSMYKYIT
ncbi:cullin-3 [Eremomyces bilateralis CBS 781.70]|uniref:Cullin-3 n=1 Tax=Eremomyces bilateralis CBS 781.70 TaxID=1392243 RepID=A0A6G1GDS0_9PEZI|nr:cullin-3 [Eremomyces bilateralis CBS 781.70]KAF1816164.1 cullin-3 [Eremomyces bilateralis CBS 781.70]